MKKNSLFQNKQLPIWFLNLSIVVWLGLSAVNSDLPPRPPDNPPETSDPVESEASAQPRNGSQIMFQVQSTTFDADDWAAVEWQTVDGRWITVSGWQGTFSYTNDQPQVEWWVGSPQLGSGPYRWVVYPNQQSNTAEYISQSFYLPENSGQKTIISK